ncbi:MAG: GlxA family transcriptional regulator [Gammaproteobacteria bacterium]
MRVAVLALDGCFASTIHALVDTLRIANAFVDRRVGARARHIDWQVLSVSGRTVRSAAGAPIAVDGALSGAGEPFDAVFVPAVEFDTAAGFARRLARGARASAWIRRQHAGGAILAAVGTGVCVLAQSGALDRRRVAVPYWLARVFRQRYPAVRLDTARGLTEDEGVICVAGIGAATVAARHLLARLVTPQIVTLVAQAMMPAEVDESRLEDGARALPPTGDEFMDRARYWLQRNLGARVSMADLAAEMLVSERTLARRFKRALGVTPHAYLHALRMESAGHFLTRTRLGIARIASRVGYRDAAFFREVFHAYAGMGPLAYRQARSRPPAPNKPGRPPRR